MSRVMNLFAGIPKDANLKPEHIKQGVTIQGVTGTLPPTIVLTQAAYDALTEKDSNTLYLVKE